jgi:hypothetical protein
MGSSSSLVGYQLGVLVVLGSNPSDPTTTCMHHNYFLFRNACIAFACDMARAAPTELHVYIFALDPDENQFGIFQSK